MHRIRKVLIQILPFTQYPHDLGQRCPYVAHEPDVAQQGHCATLVGWSVHAENKESYVLLCA